ncbi:MAG: histidine kinase [Butyrivibrio sp.]|nr:histidine kinase [Butyrivibrio sp.]
MSKDIKSFQDNIRRTFIVLSLTPVIAIVFTAILLFIFTWSAYMAETTREDSKNIAAEADGVLSTYYSMLGDVEFVVSTANVDVDSVTDKIFSIIYSSTSDYEDIGNLIIMSPERRALFSSKNNVPEYLTGREYSNWGVWNRIKQNPNVTKTILYEGTLYVVRGVFRGQEPVYALIYAVPSQVMADIINTKNRYCLMTDDNGWVYLNNTQGFTDKFGQINGSLQGRMGYARIGGQKVICYETSVEKGLKIYTFSDINRSTRMIIILVVIVAVIFFAIVFITYRSTAKSSEVYTRDVKKIEDAFEKVQQGNLDVSLNIDSSKEFQTIGNDFNEMLDGLKKQIEQNKELAQNAAFSQVKQLESQFNPHFLFNTLDNIRFMAKIDAASADKMIVSLSGLLRYSIRETREEVTVAEDLRNLQFYLNILQIRFNKRFAYSINVSEDISECLIPKLLLQPLLENAVKYGFGEKEKLTVNINGYQHQERLIFVCVDDGVGIDEDVLAEIKATLQDTGATPAHFGLFNIHQRIKLMYNGDYGLDISSKKGEGTTVRLTLPKRVAQKMQAKEE